MEFQVGSGTIRSPGQVRPGAQTLECLTDCGPTTSPVGSDEKLDCSLTGSLQATLKTIEIIIIHDSLGYQLTVNSSPWACTCQTCL